MEFPPLNYLAILVAALAAFFIGFMWHGPVFGKVWLKLMNISEKEIEKGKKEMAGKMPVYMISAFLQQVVVASAIALLVSATGVTAAVDGALLAFVCWLGFIATTLLNGVLWEKRTVPLYLFNIAYHFVSLVVITLIVTLWI